MIHLGNSHTFGMLAAYESRFVVVMFFKSVFGRLEYFTTPMLTGNPTTCASVENSHRGNKKATILLYSIHRPHTSVWV